MSDAIASPKKDLRAYVLRAELAKGEPGAGFDVLIRLDDSPLGRIELQVRSGALTIQDLPTTLRRELLLLGQKIVNTMDTDGVGFARH